MSHLDSDFENIALQLFNLQYQTNDIYKKYCSYINRAPHQVKSIQDIPFLPISAFKTSSVKSGRYEPEITFYSSGTGGNSSQHQIKKVELYEKSFIKNFEHNYGKIDEYCILALLPSYLEKGNSSLVYMVNELIKRSNHSESGFFLYDFDKLEKVLNSLLKSNMKVILIGVSYALLDFVEAFKINGNDRLIVMETGGMKGKKKEIVREELHETLKIGFSIDKIHSEYGMTELLSQAYSMKNGMFHPPPWMRVYSRKLEDPFDSCHINEVGGINIIDLANIHSVSFIQTDDVGKVYKEGSFEVLGRSDNSEVRGCNLLYT